jgi:DDE superfamily endonuclease
MLDEPLITETPPLVACYGPRGEQVEVPVTGQHARRVLHGVRNIRSGGVLFLITETWDQQRHQAFLEMIRRHWSGWHLILFADRGSPHTAATSRQRAKALGMEVRCLPRATPELKAMDHLWR